MTAYFTAAPHLALRRGDVLICDASDAAVRAGATCRDALASAFYAGVQCFSLVGLHAKLFLLDDLVVVGSMNATLNSARLCEACYIGKNASDRAAAEEVFAKVRDAATPVTEQTLLRLQRLPLADRTKTVNAPALAMTLSREGQRRSWSVLLDDGWMDEHPTEMELQGSEIARRQLPAGVSDVYWFRGSSRSACRRMQIGDLVVSIWASRPGKARYVFRPEPILHIETEGSTVWVYLAEPPQARVAPLLERRVTTLLRPAVPDSRWKPRQFARSIHPSTCDQIDRLFI
ncbi:MAG: hypothetical protein HND58_12975 [Planctomycetota bacterium]|nr:MAG: hypothetical protein HND58_12975 [Planctomycetota bacterium]